MTWSFPRRSGARLGLFFALSFAFAGCGAPGQFAPPSSGGGSPDEISREEIASLPDGDAYQIIQQLRPRWVRTRVTGTFGSVAAAGDGGDGAIYAVVFVDDMRFGEIDSLRQIRSPEIERIEYINARDATTLYGTGYMAGVIRVRTRR